METDQRFEILFNFVNVLVICVVTQTVRIRPKGIFVRFFVIFQLAENAREIILVGRLMIQGRPNLREQILVHN